MPYSKRKKQGLRLLMAGHSPQAKCLCEILVQKGIRVNHTDVAWHSPEVMLEDVKGQLAERFWLKISYPQMRKVFAGFTHIMPNPVSFVLCMGVREMHEEQVVACPVGRRNFQNRIQPWAMGVKVIHRESRPTMMYVQLFGPLKRATFPWGTSTLKTLVWRVVSTRSTTNHTVRHLRFGWYGPKLGTSNKQDIDGLIL